FDELGVRAAVREEVAADKSLSANDRVVAGQVLDDLREDADNLLAKSLKRSITRTATKAQRRLALHQAEAAVRLVLRGETRPERMPAKASLYLTALGLAKLRAGQAKEALAELTRAVAVQRLHRGAAVVRQMAGLALAAK